MPQDPSGQDHLDADIAKLRAELDRSTIERPTMYSLPEAQPFEPSEPPPRAAAGEERCPARARYEVRRMRRFVRLPVDQRWEVRCVRRSGHADHHVAEEAAPGRRPGSIWLHWQ